MAALTSAELSFSDNTLALQLYGELNRNLAIVEEATGVAIQVRGTELSLKGREHEVALAASALRKLYELIRSGYPVYPPDVAYALRVLEASPKAVLKEIFLDKVYITAEQKVISPKSINQKFYIDAIRQHDIVFGIGPAGTGKTYLAVAMAVAAYASRQVKTIILARPAVEAGERLGFLPGDLAQKVNPYLRPLHDALNDMLGPGKAAELLEEGIIEIAPLAFMRGRTLNNAFVILDEAQNSTSEQMKMFLTRLGFSSKAVITGDVTQVDLPLEKKSGLIEARRILNRVDGIAFCDFTDIDVVRHPLVQKIIRAYARQGGGREAKPGREKAKKPSPARASAERSPLKPGA
ncbi:PhoH family protein [Desulfurivibrio sp. C05AmB]|jgi:phosphate starvation-inducible protein PhoH and related proteins|uniref:PhoH family protein n=1 Tax=Desulfurivibrio sp. C05AmB TaxID=3374371 RepID=UPI00376F37A2